MSEKLQSGDLPDPNKYDRNRMYGRLSSMSWSERESYLQELRVENDRDLIGLFHEINIGLDKDRTEKLHHLADDPWLAEMCHRHIRDSLSTTDTVALLEFQDMLQNYFPIGEGGSRDEIVRKTMTLVDGELERRDQEVDREKSKLRSKD